MRLTEAQLLQMKKKGVKFVDQGGASHSTSKGQARQIQSEKQVFPKDTDRSKPRKKGRDRAAVEEYTFEPFIIRIDLPHNPRPKGRPRTVLNRKIIASAFAAAHGNVARFFSSLHDNETGKSRAQVTITPDRTQKYENYLREEIQKAMHGRAALHGPVKADFLFVLDGENEQWPTSPADGDADNLEKAVADALNEVAFTDDRFIVITSRMKICRKGERGVLIRISAASPDDLHYNGLIDAWCQERA